MNKMLINSKRMSVHLLTIGQAGRKNFIEYYQSEYKTKAGT